MKYYLRQEGEGFLFGTEKQTWTKFSKPFDADSDDDAKRKAPGHLEKGYKFLELLKLVPVEIGGAITYVSETVPWG